MLAYSMCQLADRVAHGKVSPVQGTAIEATLWREAADKHFDSLQEGKVSYRQHAHSCLALVQA